MSEPCIRIFADAEQIRQCKEEISRVEDSIVSVSRALNLAGNEVRLKMLYLLYKETKMCPCDLSDILGMSVPAISQHLRKLKDGGLVSSNKAGQTIFYSILKEHDQILDPIFKLVTLKIPA